MNEKIIYLLVWFSLLALDMKGQETGQPINNQDKKHKYHLGVGLAGTYLTGDQELSPGVDLHFVRQIGEKELWGIGIGYEAIFSENFHNGINLLVNYQPLNFLSVVAGPGMVIAKSKSETEVVPSFHCETVFEFDVKSIHLGPMIGFGIDPDDIHLAAGIHVGIGF